MKTGNKIAFFYTAMTVGIIAFVTILFYFIATSYISRLYYSYLTEKAYATAQKHWEKDETDDESYARIQQRYEETLPVVACCYRNITERGQYFGDTYDIDPLYDGERDRTII